MWIRQKASLLVVTSLLSVSLVRGQAPVQTATPPPSSAGIFPLATVHAGLHGTAYTVFEGTVPEPFGVNILGVLHNAQGPGEDLILARLTGAKAEYTGVVAGMSGSPVYIDGKLVGAIAFRIGEFSKEPIAGITPIAQMLPVRDLGARSEEAARSEQAIHLDQTAQATVNPRAEIMPIETPLVFSGFSPAALALWKEHAPALGGGLAPQAGLGGAGSSELAEASSSASARPLEPGSAVSALLVAGDMEIAATCTVTYLDAGHLLACGHPLTQFGEVSLPMTEADVVATLASPAGSFKIVNTGKVVGAFDEDRQTAIGGLLGATAHMIPVEIALHSTPRTEAPGKQVPGAEVQARTLHLRVLDQAQLTPTAVLVSLFQALQQSPGYAEEASYQVHATVQVAGYPPVTFGTLAAPGGLGPAALAAALNVGVRLNALYSSSDRRRPIESVHIDVETMAGRQVATLSRATLERTTAHAGERITVNATVAPYRGDPRSLRISVSLPAALPQGEVRLLVSDGPALDRLLAQGRSTAATPLSGTIDQLNGLHADDRLYVTLFAPDAELSVDGRVLASVPPSIANLLLPAHERERTSLHGESATTLGEAALHQAFTGEQILTLHVE